LPIDVLDTPKHERKPHDTSFRFQDYQCRSSDQRCRGSRRAACGPEEERIAGFLKNSFRAAGI